MTSVMIRRRTRMERDDGKSFQVGGFLVTTREEKKYWCG